MRLHQGEMEGLMVSGGGLSKCKCMKCQMKLIVDIVERVKDRVDQQQQKKCRKEHAKVTFNDAPGRKGKKKTRDNCPCGNFHSSERDIEDSRQNACCCCCCRDRRESGGKSRKSKKEKGKTARRESVRIAPQRIDTSRKCTSCRDHHDNRGEELFACGQYHPRDKMDNPRDELFVCGQFHDEEKRQKGEKQQLRCCDLMNDDRSKGETATKCPDKGKSNCHNGKTSEKQRRSTNANKDAPELMCCGELRMRGEEADGKAHTCCDHHEFERANSKDGRCSCGNMLSECPQKVGAEQRALQQQKATSNSATNDNPKCCCKWCTAATPVYTNKQPQPKSRKGSGSKKCCCAQCSAGVQVYSNDQQCTCDACLQPSSHQHDDPAAVAHSCSCTCTICRLVQSGQYVVRAVIV